MNTRPRYSPGFVLALVAFLCTATALADSKYLSFATEDEANTMEIFEKASPAVVYVTNTELRRSFFTLNVEEIPRGSGTGFVWDESGLVVTNFHVIAGAHKLTVTTAERAEYPADVIGVAHTHTAWGTPFCATGRPILPITQEACNFVDDWAFFDDEEVQVLGTAGGARIAESLGDNRAVLLRSHGLLTACASVGETIAAFVVLERVCEALMKAPEAKGISDEAARIAREDLYRHRALDTAFDFLVSRHVGDPAVVG